MIPSQRQGSPGLGTRLEAGGVQRRSDTLTDVRGTPYHVSEHGKINVATALEVRFCTSHVELTRACRSTILGLRIVEKGLYCSCVSVELRSDNFAARAG